MALVSLIYSRRKMIHILSALEKQHCLCLEPCQENCISKSPLDLTLHFSLICIESVTELITQGFSPILSFFPPCTPMYYRNTVKICPVILSYVLGHVENEWCKICLLFLHIILFVVTRNLAKLPCLLSANYFTLIS